VREMHQLIAAGKTLAARRRRDGKTYIAAKIVDPLAIRKIEEGVYKGFSIGGTVPPGGRNKDDPKIIEQLKLSEISLVDRPANPDCVVTLYKAEAEPQAEAVQTSGSAEPVAKTEPAETPVETVLTDVSFTVKIAAVDVEAVRALVADPDFAKSLLAKRGAKFSKSTAAALKKCHGMIQECDKAMGALGYDKVDDDDVADAAEIGELRKSVAAAEDATKQAGDALKKVLAERDTAQAELTKTTAALAEAKVRLETKGVLKIVPVEKKDDVAAAAEAKKFDELPPHEQVKEIHKAGGRRIA
jgi:hypothetical protein